MASDPRLFLRPGCRKDQKFQQNNAQESKSFIDSLGDVGNLEFLNDAGIGNISQGLRTLASVSDSIRTGEGSGQGDGGDGNVFNSTLGSIAGTGAQFVEQGADTVLGTIGIDPNAARQALDFNPDVVNRAFGQAEKIFEDVKNGDFSLEDIPQRFQDLQNLEQLIKGIKTDQVRPQRELCTASPYARELIRYAPKQKFLFVVDVQFSPAYKEWDPYGKGMAFVVKNSSRPQVEWEHEEVNMYNFHTNIPKRTIFHPVSLTFYDDNKNYAQLFHTAYTRAMSPITNIKQDQRTQGPAFFEQKSMDFTNELSGGTFSPGEPHTRGYAASLGPLNDNTVNVLDQIRLFHIFDYGRLANVYYFYNPKIQNFTPDELDMTTSGEGTQMEINFIYDSLFMAPGYSIQNSDGSIDIAQLTGEDGRAESYYIKPVFDRENEISQEAPPAQDQVPISVNSRNDPTTASEVLNDTTGGNSSNSGLNRDAIERDF